MWSSVWIRAWLLESGGIQPLGKVIAGTRIWNLDFILWVGNDINVYEAGK